MNLRTKTLLTIGTTLVCLIFILYAMSQLVLMHSFAKIEDGEVREDVDFAVSSLDTVMAGMCRATGYWSGEDDIYAFLREADLDQIDSSLDQGIISSDTFDRLGINLMMFIDSEGETVFIKAYDPQGHQMVAPPEGLAMDLSTCRFSPGYMDGEGSYRGIIEVPGGLMMVISHPVMNRGEDGRSIGRLMTGRYLTAPEILRLSRTSRQNLTIIGLNDASMPQDFKEAKAALSNSSSIVVLPLSEERVAGYTFIRDIRDNPVMILRVDSPRSEYTLGAMSLRYFLFLFAIAGIFITGVVLIYLDKSVLSRLSLLSARVSDIGARSDPSSRMPVDGEDELSGLAVSINGMLSALEAVQMDLRESGERLRLALSTADMTIWDLDLVSGRMVWSGNLQSRLGIPAFGGGYEDLLSLVHEDDRGEVDEFYRGVTGGSESDIDHKIEFRLVGEGGRIVWIYSTGRIFLDDLGAPSRMMGVYWDITSRKAMEEELRSARDLLEARVAQRTAELAGVNRELQMEVEGHRKTEEELRRSRMVAEAANRAKSEFLANMSHEIRTPMNAVIGMTGILLDDGLTPSQKEYVETIRSSGNALLSIINDILDFSKIEEGKMELELRSFNIRAAIEESLDLVAARAAEKGLNLAYTIDRGVPEFIAGDQTRLRQVMVNLLNNAVKFTEKGEVVVCVSSSAGDDGLLDIEFGVIDTGIGIPEDRMNRLFQSFSQIDTSTTRKYGGTGLGLAICKRLVELMGGRIWVSSKLGAGSAFRFNIKAKAVDGGNEGADLTALAALQGRRILILDDCETNRRIIEALSASWGMMPTSAASGAEALEIVGRGERFDIAVLELEAGGESAASEIQRSQKIPLIMVKSVGERPSVGNGTLIRPIKPSSLQSALIRALSGEEAAPVGEDTAKACETESPPLRILLAEDNVVNQKVMQRMLSKLGYRADIAESGVEVLQALERERYDLVLMDVQMPEMDGIEAARAIQARWPKGDQPRIIAVTAHALSGDKERCIEAGMDGYIAKPVRIEELTEVLKAGH